MNLLQMIGVEPVKDIQESEQSEEQLSVAQLSHSDLSKTLDSFGKRLESIESSQFVIAEILVALMKRSEEYASGWPRVDIQQKQTFPLRQDTFRIDNKSSIETITQP